MEKQFEKFKGITLVALVITIVVLLILAGVSINLVIGDNGIITKAQEASKKYQNLSTNEKEEISNLEDEINSFDIPMVVDKNPGELERENENTLVINSMEDLVYFSYSVQSGDNYEGKIVKLGLTLDFKAHKSYVDYNRSDYSQYGYNGPLQTILTSTQGFIPIGTMEHPFKGIFDGQENKLINILIKWENYSGLFGVIENATIKNITITGNITTITGNEKVASSVVGYIADGTNYITNCTNYADIKANTHVGGIVGLVNSNGSVSLYIENCANYGKVESESYVAGGILGNSGNASKVEICDCINYSDINGARTAGGIIGVQMNNGKLKLNVYNSCNFGNIKAQEFCAGIIGQNDATTVAEIHISNVYNIGKINSEAGCDSSILSMSSWRKPIMENCYWMEGTSERGVYTVNTENIEIESITQEMMQSKEFITKLNEAKELNWKKWVKGQDGYPVLQ